MRSLEPRQRFGLLSRPAYLGLSLLALLAGSLALAACGRLSAQELSAPEQEAALPPELQRIYLSGVPESVEDLRLMDHYQQSLVKQVARVTVGLQIDPTQGSGVIVSRDGYVLTAAHVAGRAGLEVRVIMPDGQKYRGTTLGMNRGVDAALVKIDPQVRDGKPVEWPFAQMGDAMELTPGSWCMALGHPGGYQDDRQPVVRFGRVLATNTSVIETDCKLVGGDSGGPLFDMTGRVIGIHSRIGSKVTKNLHVPVDNYRASWERLARGDSWGSLLDVIGRPVIGVLGEKETNEPRIAQVLPASPAERAGIKPGDLVTKFADEQVDTFDRLKELVNRRQPGDQVTVEVVRGDERLELKLILGAMASS